MSARGTALRSAGRSIVDLGTGVPAFETPAFVTQAAERAMRAGATRYTAVDGTHELKEAVAAKFERENGVRFAIDEISIGAGAKQVIFNALFATAAAGDEVIIPAPYYPAYAGICRLINASPIVVPTSDETGFTMTAEALEAAITPRTRWVILNSPGNPTGAVYTGARFEALGEVLLPRARVLVMSDEIYEHMVYEGEPESFVAAVPALRERTLTINGVSKTYAMTGWRIGYGAGPRDLIRAMAAIQAQVTTSPSSIGQAAAVAALAGPQDVVAERRLILRRQRDLAVAQLSAMAGVACPRPAGAMYAFPRCTDLIDAVTPEGTRIDSDQALTGYLLESAGVAVVPGSAHGMSGHVRITFAVSEADLEEGLTRIGNAVGQLEGTWHTT